MTRSLIVLTVLTVLTVVLAGGIAVALSPLGSDRFTDVPEGHYADEAIGWAVDEGITAGCGDDEFCPDQPVTRAQIVTFLHRYDQGATTTTTIPVSFDWPSVVVGDCYLIEDAFSGGHAVVEWHFEERLDPQIRKVRVDIDLVEDGRVVAFTTYTANYGGAKGGGSPNPSDNRWWLGVC